MKIVFARLKNFFLRIYASYIPNRSDSFGKIIIKSLIILAFICFVVSSGYLINYFLTAKVQENIIEDSRKIWHETVSANDNTSNEREDLSPTETLIKQNSDFKGWVTIDGTKIDNPIYQTDNNDFYLNHNQEKKWSAYGALYFDYKNEITEQKTDKNLVIYGHEMKNGSMFGTLKKLRSLDFYKQHPIVNFSTLYDYGKYKIFAVFVLNASKDDDNGKIYDIYRKTFANTEDFDGWVAEAYERSIINTGVDAQYSDNIITLVTCCEDFENARLVVMARKTRDGEDSSVDTRNSSLNPNPKYPARWYLDRKLEYPF